MTHKIQLWSYSDLFGNLNKGTAHLSLQNLYQFFFSNRNFSPEFALLAKKRLLNQFFRNEGLNSAVVGISGGIDSALVLSLLSNASMEKDSPIKKIVALSLPINNSAGATEQDEAVRLAKILYDSMKENEKIDFSVVELGDSINQMSEDIIKNKTIKPSAWAIGQLASLIRTPALYYSASLLQDSGFKSLVVGTTNKNELELGFYGKASDAMVDLQPIIDLHKSEVWSLAEYLKIPDELIKAVPKGNVWDTRNDEQMIGAPYWVVELISMIESDRLFYNDNILEILPKILSPEAFKEYQGYLTNVNKLKKINNHKTKVGLPSRSLNIF